MPEVPAQGNGEGVSVENGSSEALLEPTAHQCLHPDPTVQSDCPEGMSLVQSGQPIRDRVMAFDQTTPNGQGTCGQTVAADERVSDHMVISDLSVSHQTGTSLQGTEDQTMCNYQGLSDQMVNNNQCNVKQTTITTSADVPSLKLSEPLAMTTEDPSPEINVLPLEAMDPSESQSVVTVDTLQQPEEGMVTDRGSLSYTGEPRLMTSITAPFSADNFTKGCKW